MRALFRGLIGLVMLVALPGSFVEADTTLHATTRESSHRLISEGRQAEILKGLAVSYLGLLVADHGLESSHARQAMVASISEMLFFFDSLNNREALKIFATLDSYYLGELPDQIYDRLALRKGKALRPYLQEGVRAQTSDCIERFGAEAEAGTKPNTFRVCLDRHEFVDRTRRLVNQINAGVGCSNEELLE